MNNFYITFDWTNVYVTIFCTFLIFHFLHFSLVHDHSPVREVSQPNQDETFCPGYNKHSRLSFHARIPTAIAPSLRGSLGEQGGRVWHDARTPEVNLGVFKAKVCAVQISAGNPRRAQWGETISQTIMPDVSTIPTALYRLISPNEVSSTSLLLNFHTHG